MKTIQNPFRQLLEFLRFGQEAILYALIFVPAFFRNRPSLGCELVAIRSQPTFYKEGIRQNKQTGPRFSPASRLLWVLLSLVWSGWKPVADLMQPTTVLEWHNFGPPCPDTIRMYMIKPKGGTEKSQDWLTFLHHHTRVSWGMDLFTVPTIRVQILYVFVVLKHARTKSVLFGSRVNPQSFFVSLESHRSQDIFPHLFEKRERPCGK
jgi:hypothetical protein